MTTPVANTYKDHNGLLDTVTYGNGDQISYVYEALTDRLTQLKYDDSGIRTQKVTGGVTTNYYLNGDRVEAETNGTDTIRYFYDENGNLFGFNIKNGTYPSGANFYYIRNGQNDITGILDATGAQVVSYVYDSWGKLISTTGTLATSIGVKNPYRYRGYRYDTETGLYYLQSRYYSPEIGRFLNADATLNPGTGLTGMNVFAYCNNNPVNYFDPDGNTSIAIILGGFLALLGQAMIAVGVIAFLVIGAVGAWKLGEYLGNLSRASANALSTAYAKLNYASTATTPPPPNRGGKGTQTPSKPLYEQNGKNGFRVEVENPGNRPGQIHLQKGGVKYYYNIQEQVFRIESSTGKLAPKAIQELLTNPDVVKAIAKGLVILGY